MDIESLIKSQKVRAFDIYALGPFMIWFALASKKKPMARWPRKILFVSGVMTMVYNYQNYKKIAEELKQWSSGT